MESLVATAERLGGARADPANAASHNPPAHAAAQQCLARALAVTDALRAHAAEGRAALSEMQSAHDRAFGLLLAHSEALAAHAERGVE